MGTAGGEAVRRGTQGPVPGGATLRVLRGFYAGLEIPIECDWLVIGRGRTADLLLADPTLSRAHAAIGFDGAHFFVQDLGSTNGTFVNGGRHAQTALRDGDEIQIGKVLLRVALPV